MDATLMIEPPPCLDHAGDHGAHPQEHPPLVDGGDEVPLAVVRLDTGRPDLNSGVVDEHVDRAVRQLDVCDHLPPGVAIGDVKAVVGRLVAGRLELIGQRLPRVRRDVRDGDLRPLPREAADVGRAHAARAARHDCDLARETLTCTQAVAPGDMMKRSQVTASLARPLRWLRLC